MSVFMRGIAYICFFVTIEVIYTAIKALVKKHDFRLIGNTQIWVMPLYAFGGLFGLEPIYRALSQDSILLRFAVYGAGILVVEFAAGFIFTKIVGRCPWEYTGKYNIKGLIYPPYFPLWGGVGLIFEQVYKFTTTF
ncbi:hypothetical protein C0416_04520 [bacterium]|nr:hypothetical protein [bacterium]